jgi:hypothetical protein
MNDSEIKTGPGGTTFAGPDAVALYRATALASGLRLYAKTGMQPNRAWTPTAMLKAATGITGKKYKRGEHAKAADDIKLWADTMSAALPKS